MVIALAAVGFVGAVLTAILAWPTLGPQALLAAPVGGSLFGFLAALSLVWRFERPAFSGEVEDVRA